MRPINVTVTVVVEHEGRYLMIQEDRGATGVVWYFPSGAVEPGESLAQAAEREALEEAGYAVEPTHLLMINHGYFQDQPDLAWWRLVLLGRLRAPEPVALPEPDIIQVAWLVPDDLAARRLTNPDVPDLMRLHAMHGPGMPLSHYQFAADGALENFFR